MVLRTLTTFLFLLFLVPCAYAQCDCGVTWSDLGDPTGVSFNRPVVIMSFSGTNTYDRLPARDAEQARQMCYSQVLCSGALWDPSESHYYLFTLDASAGPSETFVADSQGLNANVVNNHDLYTTLLMDRTSNYQCPDPTLDKYWLYFQSGARARIEQLYPPYFLSDGATPCWHPALVSDVTCTNPNPTRSAASSVVAWQTSAQSFWESSGFIERFSPNEACVLTPVIYTEETFCRVPQNGCYRADCNNAARQPCDGHGFCVASLPGQNYTTPFHCQCRNYTSTLFGGIYHYMGIACEHDTSSGCRFISDPTEMCHGSNERCLPSPLFTPSCSLHGSLDVEPRCSCNSAPAATGSGSFCEVDRCDPANKCQLRGVSAGACVHTGPGTLDFACQCSNEAVGHLCEQDPAPCIAPSETTLCHGVGTCHPAGESPGSFPLSSYPNFNATKPWCACTGNVNHGQQCQFITCSSPPVTPANHGVCDPSTGTFQHCLAPFDSTGTLPSGPMCNVDLCHNFGNGTAAGTPPYTCNCKAYQQANLGSCDPSLPSTSCDVTCYPRCPTVGGSVCGPAGICTQTHNVGDTARYAQCTCPSTTPPNDPGTQGYISVTYNATTMDPGHVNNPASFSPPVSQTIKVCELYCLHGSVDASWSPTHLTPCVCPNTGYDTNVIAGVPQNPRCDHKICQNGGTWNTGTQSCVCVPPYTAGTNCARNDCDNLATPFVEGVSIPDPQHPSEGICRCNPPFTFSDITRRDCSANMCTPNGAVNSSINNHTMPAQMCVCSGVRFTECSDPTGQTCSFCTSDVCAHEGFANPADSTDCLCIFPYIDGELCQGSACGNHSITQVHSCACSSGFSGFTCDTSPCVHGAFSDTLHTCQCSPGFTGSTCSTATTVSVASSSSSSSTAHSSSSTVVATTSAHSSSSSSSSSSTDEEVVLASSSSSSTAVAVTTPVVTTTTLSLTNILLIAGGALLVVSAIVAISVTACKAPETPYTAVNRRNSRDSTSNPGDDGVDETELSPGPFQAVQQGGFHIPVRRNANGSPDGYFS